MKPSDNNAVPLCHEHHMEGHTRGWRTFQKKYSISFDLVLQGLAIDRYFPEDYLDSG